MIPIVTGKKKIIKYFQTGNVKDVFTEENQFRLQFREGIYQFHLLCLYMNFTIHTYNGTASSSL